MSALPRLLPLLLLAACGSDEVPGAALPSADEAEVRSAGCDQGLPVLLWAELSDVYVAPLASLSHFSATLTFTNPSASEPLSELQLSGLDRLPRSIALCASREALGPFKTLRAVVVAETSDGRSVVSAEQELAAEQLPRREQLVLSERRVDTR
jgi:hypothetical protein